VQEGYITSKISMVLTKGEKIEKVKSGDRYQATSSLGANYLKTEGSKLRLYIIFCKLYLLYNPGNRSMLIKLTKSA
jgi:hypothetical protein